MKISYGNKITSKKYYLTEGARGNITTNSFFSVIDFYRQTELCRGKFNLTPFIAIKTNVFTSSWWISFSHGNSQSNFSLIKQTEMKQTILEKTNLKYNRLHTTGQNRRRFSSIRHFQKWHDQVNEAFMARRGAIYVIKFLIETIIHLGDQS